MAVPKLWVWIGNPNDKLDVLRYVSATREDILNQPMVVKEIEKLRSMIREDGPAVEYADGHREWYLNGKRHREDGPAIASADGHREWYLNGKRHREDGPAIECVSGDKHWYLNGGRHREDGPAIEYVSGGKHWYLNGKQHREDGPAAEYADGHREWCLNGEKLTECEFNQRVNSCDGKVVEIEGKKYKLKLM